MMYLGKDAIGLANKIPVYDLYQSTAIPSNNSQSIIFNVIGKPDSFIIGMINRSDNVPNGIYGCTAAAGIWSEYQGGQYCGGHATGINASDSEDHWAINNTNIVYDSVNNTFTITTGSPVWFIKDWKYYLCYFLDHRQEVTSNANE